MRVRRSKPIVERNNGEKSKRSMTISSCEQHGYRRFRGGQHQFSTHGPKVATVQAIYSHSKMFFKKTGMAADLAPRGSPRAVLRLTVYCSGAEPPLTDDV